jgi:hypothetical protein
MLKKKKIKWMEGFSTWIGISAAMTAEIHWVSNYEVAKCLKKYRICMDINSQATAK